MPRLALVLCLALSAPLAWAQDPERPEDQGERSYPDKVVAIVDGTPVTRYELELACLLRGDYRELTPGSTAQQRSPTQLPLRHSASALHMSPLAFLAAQLLAGVM